MLQDRAGARNWQRISSGANKSIEPFGAVTTIITEVVVEAAFLEVPR